MKHNKIKQKEEVNMEKGEIQKLLALTLLVLAIFFIFYGITLLILNKENNNENEIVPSEIQYKEIIASQVLKQNENNYYVLVFMNEDSSNSLYDLYKGKYEALENHDKVYLVNLDNPMNKAFKSEESNLKTNNILEIKFKGATLLKISNGNIVEAYETEDAIINKFKQLIG